MYYEKENHYIKQKKILPLILNFFLHSSVFVNGQDLCPYLDGLNPALSMDIEKYIL